MKQFIVLLALLTMAHWSFALTNDHHFTDANAKLLPLRRDVVRLMASVLATKDIDVALVEFRKYGMLWDWCRRPDLLKKDSSLLNDYSRSFDVLKLDLFFVSDSLTKPSSLAPVIYCHQQLIYFISGAMTDPYRPRTMLDDSMWLVFLKPGCLYRMEDPSYRTQYLKERDGLPKFLATIANEYEQKGTNVVAQEVLKTAGLDWLLTPQTWFCMADHRARFEVAMPLPEKPPLCPKLVSLSPEFTKKALAKREQNHNIEELQEIEEEKERHGVLSVEFIEDLRLILQQMGGQTGADRVAKITATEKDMKSDLGRALLRELLTPAKPAVTEPPPQEMITLGVSQAAMALDQALDVVMAKTDSSTKTRFNMSPEDRAKIAEMRRLILDYTQSHTGDDLNGSWAWKVRWVYSFSSGYEWTRFEDAEKVVREAWDVLDRAQPTEPELIGEAALYIVGACMEYWKETHPKECAALADEGVRRYLDRGGHTAFTFKVLYETIQLLQYAMLLPENERREFYAQRVASLRTGLGNDKLNFSLRNGIACDWAFYLYNNGQADAASEVLDGWRKVNGDRVLTPQYCYVRFFAAIYGSGGWEVANEMVGHATRLIKEGESTTTTIDPYLDLVLKGFYGRITHSDYELKRRGAEFCAKARTKALEEMRQKQETMRKPAQ